MFEGIKNRYTNFEPYGTTQVHLIGLEDSVYEELSSKKMFGVYSKSSVIDFGDPEMRHRTGCREYAEMQCRVFTDYVKYLRNEKKRKRITVSSHSRTRRDMDFSRRRRLPNKRLMDRLARA